MFNNDPHHSSREVLVIVVAYGAPELLENCLSTLGRRFAVIVVDNSSERGIREVVLKAGAVYIDSGDNIGFAAAVNLALAKIFVERSMPSTDILLLNPDALIQPAEIIQLQKCLHTGRRLACVGPMLVDTSGRISDYRLRPFRSPLRAALEAVCLGAVRSSRGYVCGAVMLLDGRALMDIGGFDERFFLYAEEMDWQRRANQRGWRSAICHDARAVHMVGGTDSDGSRRALRLAVGIERYVRKHYGSLGWGIYRWAMVLAEARRFAVRRGKRRRCAAQQVRILVQNPERAARKVGVVPRISHKVPTFCNVHCEPTDHS